MPSLLVTVLILATSYGQSQNTLHSAAEKGDVEQVKTILAASDNINQRDQRGYTALMAAASKGQVQAMQALIERAADINAKDNSASTALHIAASAGQIGAVKLLLDRGADATLRNGTGLTALDIAQNSQNADIVAAIQSTFAATGTIQPSEDPNKVWHNAAVRAVSDPNQVGQRIASQNLGHAIDELAQSGQEEQKAWLSRGPTQRSRLVRAIQTQATAEFRCLEVTAKTEVAPKTAADANGLQSLWEKRLEFVSERIREARRQEMAQATGRPYVPPATRPSPANPARPVVSVVPDPNANKGYFAVARLRVDEEQLAATWATNSSTNDNTDRLASDVNDLMLRDLGYLRATAKAEKASDKTLTAIDAVILLRTQRHVAVLSGIQSQAASGARLQNAGGFGQATGQQQGRRGGTQTTQGSTPGYGRGNRRNR